MHKLKATKDVYVNLILRDLAFAEPDLFIQFSNETNDSKKKNFFKMLWTGLKLNPKRYHSDDFIATFRKLRNGSDLIIVRLPVLMSEYSPLYVGMLANGTKRFYVLENDSEHKYNLGCWEQLVSKTGEPRYFILKTDLKISVDEFYNSISELEP